MRRYFPRGADAAKHDSLSFRHTEGYRCTLCTEGEKMIPVILLHAIILWQSQVKLSGQADAHSVSFGQHEYEPPDQFSKPYVFSVVQEGHVESGKVPCIPLYGCSPVTIHEKVMDVASLEWD